MAGRGHSNKLLTHAPSTKTSALGFGLSKYQRPEVHCRFVSANLCFRLICLDAMCDLRYFVFYFMFCVFLCLLCWMCDHNVPCRMDCHSARCLLAQKLHMDCEFRSVLTVAYFFAGTFSAAEPPRHVSHNGAKDVS